VQAQFVLDPVRLSFTLKDTVFRLDDPGLVAPRQRLD